jgi:signal transduction histidine kinase
MNLHMGQQVEQRTLPEPPLRSAASDSMKAARGLSSKLLLMTLAFVMIAEVLIFVPSVANFRNVWLQNRLDTAEAASIVFLDSDISMLSEEAGRDLLQSTMAVNVAIRRDGASQLMASSDISSELVYHINLDETGPLNSITSSLGMILENPDALYRVFGTLRSGEGTIELVMEMRHIQVALWVYARNVLILSLLISMFTAALVYFALYRLIVLPIKRISSNMERFSAEMENPDLVLEPGGRNDEIGIAEERISAFQKELQKTLRQKQHLAELGLAVSKINHDMRNILASAQLFSDRLTALPDPTVQRFAPKLIRSIDRAVDYTKSVLDYGKAIESPPKRRKLLVHSTVEEIAEMLGLSEEAVNGIRWSNRIELDLEADADPEQLFRVLMNLCRNAVQALDDCEMNDREAEITVHGKRDGDTVSITVSDNGPGIPEHVRNKIFRAFEGSTRSGGSGLGVTIAMELVKAHGGTITITKTSPEGTVFEVRIPDSNRPDNDHTSPANL